MARPSRPRSISSHVSRRAITLADIDAVTTPIRSTQLEFQWFDDRGLTRVGGGNRETMHYIERLERALAIFGVTPPRPPSRPR